MIEKTNTTFEISDQKFIKINSKTIIKNLLLHGEINYSSKEMGVIKRILYLHCFLLTRKICST